MPEIKPVSLQTRKILIFFATYNELGNINQLLNGIWAACPTADVLVVDDSSPDRTGEVLQKLEKTEKRLKVINRPRKLGLGSAHFIAMIYALNHNYDFLVTMDADLSHDPADIPRILARLEQVDFVIGSRYMPGGSCDYTGYRKQLSLAANSATRLLTGIPIHEFTTSFRGFKVNALSKVKFNWIGNLGYSFFLESVVRLNKAGLSISEIPIHFYNRHSGKSKIPSFEIFRGAYKLFSLTLLENFKTKSVEKSLLIRDHCINCGGYYLFEVFPEIRVEKGALIDSNVYKCSSMSFKDKPQIAKCFQCGLVQIPLSKHPKELDSLYENVIDSEYITNLKVKEKTFSFAFRQLRPFLPVCGTLLEIGSYCGLFSKEAKHYGWQCVGIEPSSWAATYAVQRDPTLKIINAPFSKAIHNLSAPFDVVVSWDVIEHVADPSIFIRDAASLLPPGGIFAFSTLDISSWFPRLLGKRWPWMMAMHLYYFTPDVLRDMLNRQGMELIHVDGYRHYASLSYLFKKLIHFLPNFFHPVLLRIAGSIPEVIVPVTLGDVKLFIARKI